MNKKNTRKASRRNLKATAVIFIAALTAGCSSGTERFADSFYSNAVPNNQSNVSNTEVYQPNQSPNGAVVSNQLPPPPTYQTYESQQTYPVQTASNGQIMGAPPQNLGTIPASDDTSFAPQTIYTVQSGDTLYNISRRSGVSVDAIRDANNIFNGVIHIGQTLTIPGAASVAARAPTTPSVIASNPQEQRQPARPALTISTNNTPTQNVSQPTKIVEAPAVAIKEEPKAITTPAPQNTQNTQVATIAPQATGIAKLRWPAQGRILSSFGQNQSGTVNDGIDIMVPEGASVRAAENGVVIDAVQGLKKFGNTVLIRHENNIVTVYGHNSKIFVQRGQKVRRGDEIAKSGMSGDAATPRVHFEVRKNAAPVNPIDYLEN